MASIKKRGPNAYQITVSNGYDRQNKKIAAYKTVALDPDMTVRQQEKEVDRFAMEFEQEVKTGRYIDPSVTFEDFVERWLIEYAEQHLERKTISSYKCELRTKILPAIRHIKLSQLQPLHLNHYYKNLTEPGIRLDGKPGGYSTRTIKYSHQIISSILQIAVNWIVIQDNPTSRVRPPKGEHREKKHNFF